MNEKAANMKRSQQERDSRFHMMTSRICTSDKYLADYQGLVNKLMLDLHASTDELKRILKID